MHANQFFETLDKPPSDKMRKESKSIVRVAKARLTWNESAMEWVWGEPEGISHYIEKKPLPPSAVLEPVPQG